MCINAECRAKEQLVPGLESLLYGLAGDWTHNLQIRQ